MAHQVLTYLMSITQQELYAKMAANLDRLNALSKYRKSKTREPYYREDYAIWFRDNVLAKIQRGENVEVEVTKERSLATVGCLLSQARKYLFAELDPGGKWQEVWNMTQTQREDSGRKRYRFFPSVNMDNSMRVVTPVNFYGELTDYLNSLSGKEDGACIFEKEGLFMSEYDVDKINGILREYKSLITYVCDHSKLKIINVPSE